MNLVVKGRHARISAQVRERVERKFSHLARLGPRLDLVEVQVIRESNPRVNGGHRVDASCRSGRSTFRASGTGGDIEAALDQVVERLERQLTEDHRKRRARLMEGANRVKSRRMAASREEHPDQATPEEE